MSQKKSIEDYILPLDETIKEAATLVEIGVKTQMPEISFTMDVAVSLLTYTIKYQEMLKGKDFQELHAILFGENQEEENEEQ